MMKLKVISYKSQPPTQALECSFDELGGAIGRGEGNALVLPDPERFISRIHATIAFRNGAYVLRDLSSATPIKVNGRPLGNGQEAALTNGDKIVIGSYLLQAFATASAQGGAADATPTQTGGAGKASRPRDDPLDLFGGLAADPFTDVSSGSDAAPPARRNQGPGSHDAVPTGFNPFPELANDFARRSPNARNPGGSQVNIDLGIAPASSQNLDELFGLGAGTADDPFSQGHPLSSADDTPAVNGSLDPMVAIGAASAPKPAPAAQPDTIDEIHGAYLPPVATFPDAGARDDTATPDPNSMLFSWQESQHATGGDIKTMVIPSPHTAAASLERNEARPSSWASQNPSPSKADIAGASPTSLREPAEPDALLHAFLQGAGVPGLALAGPLTPEAMHTIGQLLRVSTQGLLDLLLARALLKREIHAERTMIASSENNPLKFSPNVEVALDHLLLPRGQGFMAPVAAIHDACNDLRAHQFGMMAGMRAALDGVLRRFDPERLERRLAGNGIVDSMIPMHRKAKLWAKFDELYAEINQEAHEDFQALFGKEFLHAYQSQLDKLDERDKQAGATPVDGRQQPGRGNGA
jgi:FHA domain-containing protein